MTIDSEFAPRSVSPPVSGGMSKKTLFILLGIFVALGAAASYSWWSPYLGLGKKPRISYELVFTNLTENAASKFSIAKKGEEDRVFIKEEGAWKVNDFDVSKKEIEVFFSELSGSIVESLASKNPENHSNFELTEENGTILSVLQGDAVSMIIIGKQGPVVDSFFARTKESNNVYLVSGSLLNKISQNADAWRDKVIVDISTELIKKVEIISKKNLLVIEKQGTEWKAEGAGKTTILDEATIGKLLAAFNPLEASGFLDEEERKEFEIEKAKTSVIVYGGDDDIIAEIQFVEKDNDWWAVVKGKDIYYKIPSYQMSNIMLKHEDIFK